MRGPLFRSAIIAAAGAIGVGACFDFGGLGGGNDTGSSDASSDAGGDTASSSSCPAGCLPPAPSGWTGPSAVYDGPPSGKPAACPGVYSKKELDAVQGVNAQPASCTCGSPTFSGASCRASVSAWPSAGCSSGMPVFEGTIAVPGAGGCLTTGDTGFLEVSTAAIVDAGTCAFAAPTIDVPDASVSSANLACGLDPPTACASSPSCIAAPAPDAPFTQRCIHQDGDVPCPSGDYAARFVAYKSISDTRGCSPCVGTATGGTCGASWGIASSLDKCAVSPPSGFSTDHCGGDVSYPAGSVVGGAIGPTGIACAGDGGSPQGQAMPADPVTFCCAN